LSGYRAPWWLPGGHLQTILPALAPRPRIAWRRERWDTPDGDFIDLDWAGDAGPLLVLFHGLEGGSSSHYSRSIAAQALRAGWRCVVSHFRGCSGEINRLPRAYHSGDSDELDWILRRLRPDFAAGVSLGGNVLLKWLGERGAGAAGIVRRAAAVSAPLDLAASGRALDRGVNRRLYTRLFLLTMKAKAYARITLHRTPIDERRLARARSLHEFDDIVTAPWLEHIRVPTLVLNARNDPFLPEAALERATRKAAPAVLLEFPRAGGHVGFPGGRGWLARRVLEFLSLP
jgi:hypothetical protein